MFKYSLFTCLLFIACNAGIQKASTNMPAIAFDQQGHRGCRGLMPENTIPAMLKAIDLGVTTLETDAVITKDKQVVLSHEPFFNHEISAHPDGRKVSAGEEKSLNIYQMDYAEVKRYDVGMQPYPRFPQQQKQPAVKPLLADMIDAAEQYCAAQKKQPVHYNIETKSAAQTDGIYHPAPAEFVELLVGVIRSRKVEERVTIQSFDIRTLQYLHQRYPGIQTALLIEDDDTRPLADQLNELGFVPTIYSPHYSLVTPALVKACRDNRLKLVPWTVNDQPTIRKLKQMGVDGIISDYPNLFAGL